jgi:hypothetical protein
LERKSKLFYAPENADFHLKGLEVPFRSFARRFRAKAWSFSSFENAPSQFIVFFLAEAKQKEKEQPNPN